MAATPKTIEELDPIPQHDPTKISEIVESVDRADEAADEQKEKEINGFRRAREVEKIVSHLINTKRNDLQGERILCLFTTKTTEATSPFKVKKIGLMHSAIASYTDMVDDVTFGPGEEFFVLIVPKRLWDGIGDDTKEALVYDALQFVGVDRSNDRRFVKKPDFTGFFNTVAEYGLWQQPLQTFGEMAKPHIAQLQLIEN